jgi:hypothetical protein
MSHLNIKTPKDNDWFAQGSVLKQGQDLGKFGRENPQGLFHLFH